MARSTDTRTRMLFAACRALERGGEPAVNVHKIAKACERAGQKAQTQSFELFLQATVDAALLGQNLQLAAESEGLGACMIGAARNHPVEIGRAHV
mgnify:CR=1 FL=1